MSNRFFGCPILNAPDKHPTQHWELDDSGQATQQIIEGRRTGGPSHRIVE